jgi:hypothetical protein
MTSSCAVFWMALSWQFSKRLQSRLVAKNPVVFDSIVPDATRNESVK